ncbi:unnamed protein product [Adineta steineri]|uniref:O-methyltransferase C-terminal domain-containing protein n=1 Tax=Adineta steineri TaxID=433720 RepID=A0A814DH65_9BILA|nr:unnamed protein product [Adineta steineri]CAF3693971.1 unnamed protein product [Adineta steineri]
MAFAPISPLTVDGLPKFLSMTYHHFINWAIYTFAELGLADRLIHAQLNTGLTIEEIVNTDKQKWNNDLLKRILNVCVYAGIVKLINDDKHFILTESGQMMTSDHPSHVRDLIRFMFGSVLTNASLQFHKIVYNQTDDKVDSFDMFTLLNKCNDKEFLSIYNGAMTTMSIEAVIKLVDGIDFSRFKTIVDLGGNRGTFLAQILKKYSNIQYGIVFDLSPIINEVNNGEEFISREVSNDKWSFISGDMLDFSTIPLADAYILKHILHGFNDNKCLKVLSSIRQANENKKNSLITIFIVEHIIFPEGATSNWQTYGLDMAMAILTDNARERTQYEYEDLLNKTGWKFIKLYPIQAPNSVIEAQFYC